MNEKLTVCACCNFGTAFTSNKQVLFELRTEVTTNEFLHRPQLKLRCIENSPGVFRGPNEYPEFIWAVWAGLWQ